MECSRIKTILLQNGDTDFPAGVRDEAQAHLAKCPSCAEFAESLRDQAVALASMPELRAPNTLVHAVRREVEKPGFLERISSGFLSVFQGGWSLRLAGTAAAAIIVVVVFQLGMQETGTQKARAPLPALKAESPEPSPAPAQDRLAAPAAPAPEMESAKMRAAALPPPMVAEKYSAMSEQSLARPGGTGIESVEPAPPSIRLRGDAARQAPHKEAKKAQDEAVSYVNVTLTIPIAETPASRTLPQTSTAAKSAGGYAALSEKPGEKFESKATRRYEKIEIDSPAPAPENPTVTRITRLIYRANGKILELRPLYILSEIPAEQYAELRGGLAALGANGADASIEPAPGTTVRLRIDLTSR